MWLYKKDDLVFNDYEWMISPEHTKFQGQPDRNMFDRNEGNDVLYLINYICAALDYTSNFHAGRIEALIHDKMPIDVKSQSSAFNWIKKEYNG